MIASADEAPQIGYVDAGEGTIAFQVFGSGPDLVVVPGLLGHLEAIWEIPESALLNRSPARDWRVVDLRQAGNRNVGSASSRQFHAAKGSSSSRVPSLWQV
jgi:hypothetical protein